MSHTLRVMQLTTCRAAYSLNSLTECDTKSKSRTGKGQSIRQNHNPERGRVRNTEKSHKTQNAQGMATMTRRQLDTGANNQGGTNNHKGNISGPM